MITVDGQLIERASFSAANRGVKPIADAASEGQSLRVPMPRRDCTISLVAQNRNGDSTPVLLRVKWGGAAQRASVKPKLHAVAIGVSAYDDPRLQLDYAATDAKKFRDALEKQKGGLYGDVQVKLLTDKGARREAVIELLEWLPNQTAKPKSFFVALA
ncbi:MAG: hypothetical protein NTY01_05620 [Verrucomicrobia bacterium]|nr:hypothetical protein [Verrucomicrobiota bacterium]